MRGVLTTVTVPSPDGSRLPEFVTGRYDPGWYELLPGLARRDTPWEATDVLVEIAARASAQKAARELRVDYYRIGYRLAFPLPLDRYPSEFPVGIEGVPDYPWMIWLAWELDERWRILAAASGQLGDEEAFRLLADELTALTDWARYNEDGDRYIALVTATLAGCLAGFLRGPDELREVAQPAADRLFQVSVLPWFESTWRSPTRPLSTGQVQNRPLIALVRAAHLAAELGHAAAPTMHERAVEAVGTLLAYRHDPERHTEGAAYDGYLLDHVTEWLTVSPGRSSLISGWAAPLAEIVRDWMHLTLPGRPDLLAPVGDVEPQMLFWMTAAIRIAGGNADGEAAEFIRRYPVQRLSAAGLSAALDLAVPSHGSLASGTRVQPMAVSLRNGWTADDPLVAVGASHASMGHLHHDGGHVVVGWRGRFWITDPGYQQYRAGLEREYTLGPAAHNCPVVDGQPETERAAQIVTVDDGHVGLDLTRCYPALGDVGSVRRDVWLAADARPGAHVVVVRDRFSGLRKGASVAYHWLGGTSMAWAFLAGWARLSSEAGALWIGTAPGTLEAAQLFRHPGTRGPLTLQVAGSLATGAGERLWVFATDPHVSWQPPDLSLESLAAAGAD
jgi:hypothetical protein